MSKGYLCMFSGGIDSTALLHTLLSGTYRKEHRIYVHHINWGEKSKSRAEKIAVSDILQYYKNGDYKDFHFTESNIDLGVRSSKRPFDLNVACFVASQVCLAHTNIEYVGIGITKDDIDRGATTTPRSLERIENAPGMFYSALFSIDESTWPELYYPTGSSTKRQLYDIIPDDVKPLIWTCAKPIWEEGSDRPKECGECLPCSHLKEFGIL